MDDIPNVRRHNMSIVHRCCVSWCSLVFADVTVRWHRSSLVLLTCEIPQIDRRNFAVLLYLTQYCRRRKWPTCSLRESAEAEKGRGYGISCSGCRFDPSCAEGVE